MTLRMCDELVIVDSFFQEDGSFPVVELPAFRYVVVVKVLNGRKRVKFRELELR